MLNIFLIILAFGYISNPNQPQHIYSMDIRYIYELKGKFFSNPYLSVSLIIALLSLAGIPPLIGFYSKQFVLTASLINDSYFIAILAIFSSVISAYYYLKIIKILLTESTKKEKIFSIPMTPVEKSSGLQQYPSDNSLTTIHINEKILLASTNWLISLSNCHSYLISILTFFLFIFLIKPTTVLNSTQVLSFSLFFT